MYLYSYWEVQKVASSKGSFSPGSRVLNIITRLAYSSSSSSAFFCFILRQHIPAAPDLAIP